MAVYILIHGAWHGGWCWEKIVPLLEAEGHKVIAPDLPGTADGSYGGDPLGLWADHVAELARAQGEAAILVGHSRGGIVVSEAAERAPEAVRRLVYVSAFLLKRGETLLGVAARDPAGADQGPMTVDEAAGTIKVDPVSGRALLYHMVSDEDAAAAGARLVPEPLAALMKPLRTTPERFGSIARAYIETERDRALSIALQRAMQAALPCDPVMTLPSDHSPFYSMPRELARALLSLA
jgi:pimeloyl-ACP methyl ester carboxylesterase